MSNLYPFFRKLLFHLPPEKAHWLALNSLKVLYQCKLTQQKKSVQPPRVVMGLSFKNPVGLAAGLDKNGEYIDALNALGFGFIEVGTVTPKPQLGNLPPRLFRFVQQKALINRMGFNNKGVDYLVEQLKKTSYQGILGINIGKNRDTPLARAVDDYRYLFKRVAVFASYITLNISSPNTPGLRQLQQSEFLIALLQTMKHEQQLFYERHKKYIPLVVKISPDLTLDAIQQMADIFLQQKIDGVIATNTTLARDQIDTLEEGGLSGKPLFTASTHVVKQLYAILQNRIPIIGCGGIDDAKTAQEKLTAGADLIQVYTGLIYQGPGLVQTLLDSVKLV